MKSENCTKEHPMPRDRDQMGQHWIHHDVTEIEDLDTFGVVYECNNCKLEFVTDTIR